MNENEYQLGPWRLDDLFPGIDSPALEEALARLDRDVEAFAASAISSLPTWQGLSFRALLDEYDAIFAPGVAPWAALPGLSFAADTQSQQAQNFMARMQQLGAELDNRTMFFKLWWKGLDDSATPSV
jgi:oligoendopeptidase F